MLGRWADAVTQDVRFSGVKTRVRLVSTVFAGRSFLACLL